MKPYTGHENLRFSKTRFNVSLGKRPVIVENRFGQLKERLNTSVETTVIITSACCVCITYEKFKTRSFSKNG